MKSLVKYMQDAYSALLFDAEQCFPMDHAEFKRDKKRLASLIDHHGIHFPCVILPGCCKIFDRALSGARLNLSGIVAMRPYRQGSAIPKLFRGLLLRVFDDSGFVLDQPDIQAIRLLRQLYQLSKKLRIACKPTDTWRSINEFYQTDRECRQGSLSWDPRDISPSDLRDLHIADHYDTELLEPDLFGWAPDTSPYCDRRFLDDLQFVFDVVSADLGVFKPQEWRAKHGPGAVSERGWDSKYEFPTWSDRLESVFPFADIGVSSYANMDTHSVASGDQSYRSDPPSRLIAVPKTLDKPRLIACEPISHQWCQQIILDFLASRISETYIGKSIHLRDQTQNARLALRASHTQSHATIDLSSASDRISCFLVERFARRNYTLLRALMACRTVWIRNDLDKHCPKFHKLRKMFTMGSACTFPIQSIIFYCVAIASVLNVRKIRPSSRSIARLSSEVRVFGDDIIIPLDASEACTRLLTFIGLKVNRNKTFETGKFRESCGCDAYDGHDVTPVRLIDSSFGIRPGSIASLVQTHNNFESKGLYTVCRLLRRVIPQSEKIVRITSASGTFGLVHTYDSPIPRLRKRWNKRLQRYEVKSLAITSKVTRRQVRGDLLLTQYFTEFAGKPSFEGDRLGQIAKGSVKVRPSWVPVDNTLIL